ncbi:MAG: hypothetical protein WA809_04195 [Candidatus Dormiibacterota bacterium]
MVATPLVFVAGSVLVLSSALMAVLGATPVSAQGSCDASGTPVTVSYQTAGSDSAISGVAVSQVVLSGFPAACDGVTATLQLFGNTAGNPALPLSSDTVLSTANSTLDACTRKQLATPLEVNAGSLTLPLCASGGSGGYVSVHDLTALALYLPAGPGGGVLAASTTGTGAAVPVTGASLPWASLVLLLGLLLLVAGMALVQDWTTSKGAKA